MGGWYTDRISKRFGNTSCGALLEVEKLIHKIGPETIREIPLITQDELRAIREIWLDEKHEFDDALPRIYEEVTGQPYDDGMISKNKYFAKPESDLLNLVCHERYKDERLLPELQHALLDMEAKSSAISNNRNVLVNLERAIKKSFFRDEEDAEEVDRARNAKTDPAPEELSLYDFVE